MRHEDIDLRSVQLYNHQNHFSIVMECKQSALIEETGLKWVKNADNDKPEVAPRERAVKAQISDP